MTAARSVTRVAIVDDHALFAESLAITIEMEGYPARRVQLEAHGSQGSLLTALTRSSPRVVLLDLDLGRLGDGTRMIEPLTSSGVATVVITANNEHMRWGECLRAGALAVLSKSAPLNDAVVAVRRVHEGLPVMSREKRTDLIDLARREGAALRETRARLERLTRREREILGQLMEGRTVREIALRGVVSEMTVRTQVKSILAKLETTAQIGAVAAAYRVGWRAPTPGGQAVPELGA